MTTKTEKTIYQAIADFQQEVPVILKDTSGYNYKYADLPAIDEVIKPLLKKHGIGVLQPLTHILSNGSVIPAIKTIIFSTSSDEKIEEVHPLPQTRMEKVNISKTDKAGNVIANEKFVVVGFEQMNEPQAQGSIITYFRRYCLSSALGLITDKDTDGTGLKADVPF